jgi:hypothetical protein
MAAYLKYYPFVGSVADAQVNIIGSDHVFKAIIHTDNTAQTASSVTSCTQPTSANGYPGTNTITYVMSPLTAALVTTAAGLAFQPTGDTVWTAAGGNLGAPTTGLQYFSIYDDTPTTPVADPLMCKFDYGAPFVVATGETMTLDYGTDLFTLA